jgi:hypothetical protein
LLGLAIVSTAGVVWLRSRPTPSGAPGADRSSPVTGHQPSSALAWYRFRTRAALQLVAIALPGVVFLARPEWVAPVMPSFESLRDATVAERLWKLGLPILCLAAFSVAVIGAGRFVRPPAALTPKGSHARTDQEARVLVAATLAVVACLLLISFERGKTLAEGAGRGDRLRQSGTLLNVSAEPVCLLGADPPFGDAGPYMLLGRSDGQIVLLALPGAGSPVPGDAAPTLVVPEEPLLYLGNDSFPATRARDRDRCRRAREDSIAGVTTTTASS